MPNNLELLKPILSFENGRLYCVKIVQRAKDLSPSDKEKHFAMKYFYSLSELENGMPDIIAECDKHHARAYITISPSNIRTFVKNFTRQMLDILIRMNDRTLPFTNIQKVVEGAVVKAVDRIEYWLIDIDQEDKNKNKYDIDDSVKYVTQCLGDKIKLQLPSKTGCHIIAEPFDLRTFKPTPNISVLGRNVGETIMTILYA